MDELRAVVESLGHTDVATYLRSGNVVFTAVAEPEVALAQALEEAIESRLGSDVRVLLRSSADLAAIVARGTAHAVDVTGLHVTFLADEPGPALIDSVDAASFLPDSFRAQGREIYVSCPAGYGRTKLSNAFFERKLAVAATTRNWRTVTALAELARS
jgi:uncharacterized protein (DUF1697 family)